MSDYGLRTTGEYYIWVSETVGSMAKRLDEFGAFHTLEATTRKIAELKRTSQYKDVILRIADLTGLWVSRAAYAA